MVYRQPDDNEEQFILISVFNHKQSIFTKNHIVLRIYNSMMTDKEIKEEIYKHYTIHRNSKIKLDTKRMLFILRLGDCECEIPYPKVVIREIKLSLLLQ